jgi:hypothetical protein
MIWLYFMMMIVTALLSLTVAFDLIERGNANPIKAIPIAFAFAAAWPITITAFLVYVIWEIHNMLP